MPIAFFPRALWVPTRTLSTRWPMRWLPDGRRECSSSAIARKYSEVLDTFLTAGARLAHAEPRARFAPPASERANVAATLCRDVGLY